MWLDFNDEINGLQSPYDLENEFNFKKQQKWKFDTKAVDFKLEKWKPQFWSFWPHKYFIQHPKQLPKFAFVKKSSAKSR